jgi:ribosomal-protein-alanine N-acetyltransferase
MECAQEVVGYSIVALAAGEAHLLNLSIAPARQRRGLGRELLDHVIGCARESRAEKIFLEVRASNVPGRELYRKAGFREIGKRRGYYPGLHGREDAIVMELALSTADS